MRLVGAAPRLEELHQLFSRAILVPFAIAFDDLEQLVGRLGAVALGVERGRQIEGGTPADREPYLPLRREPKR